MKLSNSFTFQIRDRLTFTGLLTIVFITLRLCGVINWSWFWLTCPSWGKWLVEITAGLMMDVFDEVEDEMKGDK